MKITFADQPAPSLPALGSLLPGTLFRYSETSALYMVLDRAGEVHCVGAKEDSILGVSLVTGIVGWDYPNTCVVPYTGDLLATKGKM